MCTLYDIGPDYMVMEFIDGERSAFGAPIGLAVLDLLRGEIEPAADWIARAFEQRYPGILFFVHIIGGALRESPHWPRLATMMNLPSRS